MNDKLMSKGAYPDLTDHQIKDIIDTFPDIKHVMISSVAGDRQDIIEQLKCECKVHVLDGQTKLPIKLNYSGRPGNDRIASSSAAVLLNPDGPSLIVDCGTCITYSLVLENSFAGGAISPGLQLRFKALNDYTANLPLLNYDNEDHPLLGTSTSGSIYSGVLNAATYEVDGMITAFRKDHPDLKVFLTGGMAPFFENGLKNGIFADADLVLKGLHYILRLNASQAYS
jgi:type III pantothenate kinase